MGRKQLLKHNGTVQNRSRLPRRWDNISEWGLLAPPADECPPTAAFAAILSGGAMLPQALCLADQLRRVGTRCRRVLVHDDRPSRLLSRGALDELGTAYDELVASSWLFAQASFPTVLSATPNNRSSRPRAARCRRCGARAAAPGPKPRRLRGSPARAGAR